ncbi:hypothetical protein [Fictibacillus sp. S7]|uniref:hypothetical protein n=1 Tax=Fictibacillus sp. S7 TaxID=2212476 RepID=UPI001012CA5F|nr:hypothetical protein [Fictibacillus sp. S7]RXY98717.1 hypothetical protein DMO16_02955 [Fictibacillus sp. S7]
MKKICLIIASICMLFSLTGCLYPDQQKAENRVPYNDQIQMVQGAVNDYKKDTSVLPIKNKDASTDIYEKYPIDFGRLVPKYMQQPPGNSFEKGGTFQYVLIDAETKPKVKLIDLVIVNKAQDLELRLKEYTRTHKYPPYDKILASGRYTLDYKKMGYKEAPYAVSPYSGKNLPFFVDNDSKVHVDYSIDLYEALKKSKDNKEGKDIRPLLTKNSYFVPVRSVPYGVKNGEPEFLIGKR